MSLKKLVLWGNHVFRSGVFLGFALAVQTAPAPAQPGGPAAARLALLDAVEAHGGQGALESLGDTTAAGTISVRRRDGVEKCVLTVKSRGLAAHRSEVACPVSGSHVWITDGRWGWVLADGVKKPLGLDQTADSPQVFNPALGALGLFVRGRFKPESLVEENGLLTVSGEASGSLRPDGSPVASKPVEIDLDAATKRVLAVRVRERAADGRLVPEPAEYRYSDFREADGLTLPFHIEEVRYGTVAATVSLDSFVEARHGEIFAEP